MKVVVQNHREREGVEDKMDKKRNNLKKGIPLSESNPFLRKLSKAELDYLHEMSAYQSSVFEGATGLERPLRSIKSVNHRSEPNLNVSSKKRDKGS